MTNVQDMNIEQLKAMAYDELTKLKIAQNNLEVLNQLIQNKVKENTKIESVKEIVKENKK